jgi:hypothetical protein
MCELRHMSRSGRELYHADAFQEEASMRWLLENLCPENRQIYWNWIGGVFAFYVVMMTAATGVFVAHQSAKSVTGEAAMATAVRVKHRSVAAAATPLRQVAYRQ